MILFKSDNDCTIIIASLRTNFLTVVHVDVGAINGAASRLMV